MPDNQDNLINQKLMDWIEENEESKDHMYRDSLQNVTVGVGRHLPTEDSAKSIQFRYKDKKEGRYATADEIGTAYDKVKKRRSLRCNGKKV